MKALVSALTHWKSEALKMFEIRENKEYNSREVYFDDKPDESTRASLKGLKMRWNRKKSCWYGFASEGDLLEVLREDESNQEIATPGYMGGNSNTRLKIK